MARDHHARAFIVRGREGLADRPVEESRTLCPHARPALQNGHQLGPAALELVEQELREEVVTAIPFPRLVQGDHEQVGASELAQYITRTLPTHHCVAEGACHPPQYRGFEQELPHVLGKPRQDLLSQEVDDVAVAAPERFNEGVFVLPVPQGEGGEVDPRRPPFGTLEQYGEIIGGDVQPHLFVQQVGGFLLGEGKLLGPDLVHLSPCPPPPQRQRRVRAAREDEVDVLGEVLPEEGHRLVRVVLSYELVVIENQYHPTGQLGEPVYEHGKRYLDELLPYGGHRHKNFASEVHFRHNLAQRLYYVPPQPDRIIVLLVEGDPYEGQAGFFSLTPLG